MRQSKAVFLIEKLDEVLNKNIKKGLKYGAALAAAGGAAYIAHKHGSDVLHHLGIGGHNKVVGHTPHEHTSGGHDNYTNDLNRRHSVHNHELEHGNREMDSENDIARGIRRRLAATNTHPSTDQEFKDNIDRENVVRAKVNHHKKQLAGLANREFGHYNQ